MDILRVKKAQLPAPPPTIPRKRKERKVMSAAAVMEDPTVGMGAEAGTSTGPGTAGNTGTSNLDSGSDADED